MNHTFLYTGLLGTLLGVAVNQLHAADADNVNLASYTKSTTAVRAAPADRGALKKLFHASQANAIDPLNEFSGRDWNGLTPLGATVTHEMREASERNAATAGKAFEDEARAGLY